MPGPFTPNAGFIVPNTGDLVGTWGSAALNPDYVAIDGMLCGVQGISLTNAPVTLTSPASFTPTPGAGPTQSQNRVLRLTGTLTADVTITLPIPGGYIVENLTTGAFDVIFRGAVATTEVIAVPQGDTVNIYNDGSRVRFAGLGRVGTMEHWVGLVAMPAWVGKCTVKPYLLCDATVYNVADYPYLGARFLGKFGGNGVTTFANPDLRGRVPIAYDGTGTRITVAGCGINGQTLGAALDTQTVTLTTAQIPSHWHSMFLHDPGHTHGVAAPNTYYNSSNAGNLAGGSGAGTRAIVINTATTGITHGSNPPDYNDNLTSAVGGGAAHNNVQPSIVTGIWVVKT